MSTRGSDAEALAAAYLEGHGLAVIERNFRVRGGEVDLICRDGKVVVFVEVRLRSNSRFGGAAASITSAKQRRVILAAKHYLAGKSHPSCRFDCVLFEALDSPRIEWLKNAFTAD